MAVALLSPQPWLLVSPWVAMVKLQESIFCCSCGKLGLSSQCPILAQTQLKPPRTMRMERVDGSSLSGFPTQNILKIASDETNEWYSFHTNLKKITHLNWFLSTDVIRDRTYQKGLNVKKWFPRKDGDGSQLQKVRRCYFPSHYWQKILSQISWRPQTTALLWEFHSVGFHSSHWPLTPEPKHDLKL